MRVFAVCSAVALGAVFVLAQSLSPQKMFEAGQYDQAAQAIQAKQGGPSPVESYLAGQVFLKLNQNDRAKAEFARLAASSDPVWKLIGESAIALVDGQTDVAGTRIDQAAALLTPNPAPATPPPPSPTMPKAAEQFHVAYQMGLVKSRREDWAGAAAAFERAAMIDPAFAYAHYYAGLAYSKIQRPDKVALHFDHFLSIAPQAPERAGVLSIMRTIRGK